MMDRTLNALVIDDEQPVRDFVCAVLENDGWNVSRAASAEDAFAMLGQESWPVVFCDVMLGGADGFAIQRRVAGNESCFDDRPRRRKRRPGRNGLRSL